jgi:hypothetical protein
LKISIYQKSIPKHTPNPKNINNYLKNPQPQLPLPPKLSTPQNYLSFPPLPPNPKYLKKLNQKLLNKKFF